MEANRANPGQVIERPHAALAALTAAIERLCRLYEDGNARQAALDQEEAKDPRAAELRTLLTQQEDHTLLALIEREINPNKYPSLAVDVSRYLIVRSLLGATDSEMIEGVAVLRGRARHLATLARSIEDDHTGVLTVTDASRPPTTVRAMTPALQARVPADEHAALGVLLDEVADFLPTLAEVAALAGRPIRLEAQPTHGEADA